MLFDGNGDARDDVPNRDDADDEATYQNSIRDRRRHTVISSSVGSCFSAKRSESRFRLMNSLRTTKCALNTLGVSCNTHLYNKLLDCRGTTPAINMILSTTPRLASYKASPVAGPLLPIKPPPCFFRCLRSRPRSHPPVKCSSLVHQWLRRLPTTCA